jgi:hypothetical protein
MFEGVSVCLRLMKRIAYQNGGMLSAQIISASGLHTFQDKY